jgi:hypothetical protein
MKLEMEKGMNELTQILPKVTGYDKELRLLQGSVRQSHKDIKNQGDKLGELIYNLTEATNEYKEKSTN